MRQLLAAAVLSLGTIFPAVAAAEEVQDSNEVNYGFSTYLTDLSVTEVPREDGSGFSDYTLQSKMDFSFCIQSGHSYNTSMDYTVIVSGVKSGANMNFAFYEMQKTVAAAISNFRNVNWKSDFQTAEEMSDKTDAMADNLVDVTTNAIGMHQKLPEIGYAEDASVRVKSEKPYTTASASGSSLCMPIPGALFKA